LPGVADFLDVVEVEFGDEEFVFVAAALSDDFSAGIAEVAFAVELPDFPRRFGTDAVDGGDEILIGDSVSRLLEFPQIFGEAGDSSGRIVDNFSAVEAQAARAFGEVTIVADVNADAGVTCFENRITCVAGREIKLFPEARVAMRDVMLAIFAEVTSASMTAAVLK